MKKKKAPLIYREELTDAERAEVFDCLEKLFGIDNFRITEDGLLLMKYSYNDNLNEIEMKWTRITDSRLNDAEVIYEKP